MPIVAVIPEPKSPVELREVAEPDLENDSALLLEQSFVSEALVTGYLSSSLRDAAAFFVLIGVLYFRPNGLFGSYAT